MKRFVWLLCCILLLPLLCCCGRKQVELQKPGNFYYINKEISYNTSAGVLSAELRETVDFQENLEWMLRSYLQGPKSSDLQTYIPAGTEVVSWEVAEGVAYLQFSDEFARLNGTRLSVSCGAILLSLNDFAGIDGVSIRVADCQLDDKDEVFMTMEDIVLLDAGLPANE